MAGEQATSNWWQTLPGIITAAAGCISAITALIIALHQAGLFKSDDATSTNASTTPATTVAATPVPKKKEDRVSAEANAIIATHPSAAITPTTQTGDARPAEDNTTPARLGALDDKALLQELDQANVRYSVDQATMMSWLADDDRTYRRIARASARLLNGKRLRGNATDLDVIKYHYLELVGQDGGSELAANARVDDAKLRQAIVAAFNDKNGTTAHRFDGVIENR